MPLFLFSSREWFIIIFLSAGKLAWHHVQCSVCGGEEDLLKCCVEINQNILTNILAGFQSAWLLGALSDSRMMSFRTDVKLTSLATCTVERELGPSACMGGFWVKVEQSAQRLSTFGVLHEHDSHAMARCTVCVCASNTLLPFSPPFSPLPFPPWKFCHRCQSRSRWVSVFAQLPWKFPLCQIVHGLTLSETFF